VGPTDSSTLCWLHRGPDAGAVYIHTDAGYETATQARRFHTAHVRPNTSRDYIKQVTRTRDLSPSYRPTRHDPRTGTSPPLVSALRLSVELPRALAPLGSGGFVHFVLRIFRSGVTSRRDLTRGHDTHDTESIMSDKSPFEIRAKLLEQAQGVLSENAHMQVEIAKQHKKPLKAWPAYTTEDVIREAEKLNAFVSGNGRPSGVK